MAVTKGKIAKYALLPGFIPRIFAFVTSGFSHLAYYMALVYSMVRLLPPEHPYLQPQNVGKYGVRHVIAEAANNLTFTRNNIDQVIIFFTILLGLILILLQFILLGIAFISQQQAFALGLGVDPNTLFNNPYPEQDIAFIILDKVFGMAGTDNFPPMFGSCVSAGVACEDTAGNAMRSTIPAYPYPFHHALHDMLHFYSLGILFVGAWVIIYYVITIVGETAATGTPFGQRFNKGWVPIRIVVFFGLLIPLNIGTTNGGLNGAQIITLWTAKHGSNFATSGWNYFNSNLTETYMGNQQALVAQPNIPELGSLNQFILTAKTCVFAESMSPGLRSEKEIRPYIVRNSPPAYVTNAPSGPANSKNAIEFMGTGFTQARDFSLSGTITIRIGEQNQDKYALYRGNVFPHCGDLTIYTNNISEPGSALIAERYYNMLQDMWNDSRSTTVAKCLTERTLNIASNHTSDCTELPTADYAQLQNKLYQNQIQTAVNDGIEEQRANGEFAVPPEVVEKGWAGAAIWFNRIAQMNGAVTTAVFNIPRPSKWPDVLETAYQKRIQQDADVSGLSRFSLEMSDGRHMTLPENRHLIHPAIYKAYSFWQKDGMGTSPQVSETGNIVIDTINSILGTSGLFNMRQNAGVHPLAQLTSLGKSMIESTIRNTVFAFGGTIAGGVGGLIDPFFAQLGQNASSFFFSMVTVSIGIAVILYYVLPFLPFVYFMFALSGWIKSIFEAIVAMPLWALAHIRIDGDGLPGPAASNGYFLLLEIFLRPILMLFGLLASISIFAALISVLNNIFDLVVTNISGFDIQDANTNFPASMEDLRGPVDEFFFTAMYAIIVYIIGLACFKLVDLIPNNILRWAGASVATFQENAGDPASQMTRNIYKGSLLISNQVRGSTQGNLPLIIGGS